MSWSHMASSSPSFFSPDCVPQMHPPRDEAHRALLQHPRVTGKRSTSMPFSEIDNVVEDESSDDGVQQAGERKRRLSEEQVRTLEKSFEQGNKLVPEKKMQLARALVLQPRQVAIWFQNRRARWKTKQLEKDYHALRRQLEAIKSENEALRAHNEKLQAEILALKGRDTSELINLNKETPVSCSNPSENSSERTTSMAMESSSFHHPGHALALFASARPAEMVVHCPKIEHCIAQGSFSNLLCSLEDHAAPFWPWPDQHSFH